MVSGQLKMFGTTDYTDFGLDGIGKFQINLKSQLLINLVSQPGTVDLPSVNVWVKTPYNSLLMPWEIRVSRKNRASKISTYTFSETFFVDI